MDKLPLETLHQILGYLGPDDLFSLHVIPEMEEHAAYYLAKTGVTAADLSHVKLRVDSSSLEKLKELPCVNVKPHSHSSLKPNRIFFAESIVLSSTQCQHKE